MLNNKMFRNFVTLVGKGADSKQPLPSILFLALNQYFISINQ